MRTGSEPIGNNGKSIQLHHFTQTQNGAIAEVTSVFHQKNYNIIHINTGLYPSGIDRALFNKWRRAYWISRSYDFKN